MQLPVGKHFLTIRGKIFNHTFGMVRDGGTKPHQGWDLAAVVGSPVYAITNGVIEYVRHRRVTINAQGKKVEAPYGNEVCMSFMFKGQTLYAQYAHLKSFTVAAGQYVAEGEVLGYVGQTGNPETYHVEEKELLEFGNSPKARLIAQNQHHAQSHLHFEIRTSPNGGAGLQGRLDPLTVLGAQPILDIIFSDFPKFT